MRNKKLPEFTLLLEQFFTEYMPLSSGLSPNTVRSYKHSFRLLFQYIHQAKKKEAGEILFRDLDYETVDGFLRWIETELGCSISTRNLRLSALASFAAYAQNRNFEATTVRPGALHRREFPAGNRTAENGEHEETDYRLKGVLPMSDNKQHDTRTARRPDCVTEIRMGNSVLVVSGYFKKDTTTTAADKMARVLEAEAAATQEPTYPA